MARWGILVQRIPGEARIAHSARYAVEGDALRTIRRNQSDRCGHFCARYSAVKVPFTAQHRSRDGNVSVLGFGGRVNVRRLKARGSCTAAWRQIARQLRHKRPSQPTKDTPHMQTLSYDVRSVSMSKHIRSDHKDRKAGGQTTTRCGCPTAQPKRASWTRMTKLAHE